MQPMGSVELMYAVGVDDDARVICLADRRVVVFGRGGQDHVTRCHRRQVVHQSGHVVAGLEQYQTTGPVEPSSGVGDRVGELVIRELLGVRQDRHLLAVGAKVVEESAHVCTTPVPTTSIRTLASMGGG